MKAAYFPHDFNARNDPKLQEVLMEHGVAGLGIYWCIVEMMYEQGGELPLRIIKSIAFNLHTDLAIVESIVNDFDLFVVAEDKFFSKSLKSRLQKVEEKSEKARASAKARYINKDTNEEQTQSERNANAEQKDANAMQTQSERNAIKLNKIKENEINSISSSKSCRFTPPTIEEVESYIKEKGYTFKAEAFIDHYTSNGWMVGRNKMKDWKAAVRNWARGEHKYKPQQQQQDENKHPDKRRGYDVADNADYTTTTF